MMYEDKAYAWSCDGRKHFSVDDSLIVTVTCTGAHEDTQIDVGNKLRPEYINIGRYNANEAQPKRCLFSVR